MFLSKQARRSRLAVAAFTALLVGAFTWLPGVTPAVDAQSSGDLPFTVEVDRTTNLLDGQTIQVNVTMREGATTGVGDAFICRVSESYTSHADVQSGNGKCAADKPVSASVESSQFPVRPHSGGTRARATVYIGTGTTPPIDRLDGGQPWTLTCNVDNPCQLVVRLPVTAGGTTQFHFDSSVQLAYADSDPIAGCGGQPVDAPSTAGADRMLEAWREWTLAFCQAAETGVGSPTRSPFPDEGAAVRDFMEGEVDLVYSGAGYADGQAGFDPNKEPPPDPRNPPPPVDPRPMVPVPVAVNAVVLAAAGQHVPTNEPGWPSGLGRPYSELRLTAEEMAILLGQHQTFLQFDSTRLDPLLARNPELGAVYANGVSVNPVALASPSAVSLYMTSYLDRFGGDQWRTPPNEGGGPRDVDADLGRPYPPPNDTGDPGQPGFSTSLNLVSELSSVTKAVSRFSLNITNSNPGAQWVLTDLATATRLGLTPVSIPNAAGQFVRPTPESLAAALPTMQPRQDGTLAPDVATTAPGAYPLTMVEYALVPAETLVDDASGEPRCESEVLMLAWLSYIVTDGQARLPRGFVPLPQALQQQGSEGILRVAQAAEQHCGDLVPGGGPSPTTTLGDLLGGPSSLSGSDMPSNSRTGPGATGNPDCPPAQPTEAEPATGDQQAQQPATDTCPREPTDEDRRRAQQAADDANIELPPFRGIAGFSELAPPVSVLLIVVLTSGAALATSGRPLPAAVTYVPQRVMVALAARRRRPQRRSVRDVLRAALGRGRSLLDPLGRDAS